MKFFKKLFLPFVGFASLLWFLLRVLPKPSRAMYPCQKAAFPIASAFITWLLGVFTSTFWLHLGRKKKLYLPLFFICILLTWGFTLLHSIHPFAMAQDAPFNPIDAPNTPIGEAKGVFPGRVVWSYNDRAVRWSGTGYWWEDKNNRFEEIEKMFSKSIQALTGTKSDSQAWNVLFTDFNKNAHGYQPGQKIAIKINLNSCTSHGPNNNSFFSHPMVVLILARELVNVVGVDPADITFYDATRFVPSSIFDLCKAEFPTLLFEDFTGQDGRKKIVPNKNVQVKWSKELTLEEGGGNPAWIPQSVADADYLINLGQLKGHNLAGITINAKNWFGSFISYPANGIPQSSSPSNAGVHPYVCVHGDFHFGGHWDFDKCAMKTYNSLVDLMGHEQLGLKTLLFIVDGLYSAPDQSTELKTSHKWTSELFSNDWPSSIFMSQDMVAIESVCLDFIRNESVQNWCRGNVDNYLHEAALANNPPSSTVYDPEQNGTSLQSLGVHEHWNNPQDKQYSRNLGSGNGIELVRAEYYTQVDGDVKTVNLFSLAQNYPNPFNSNTKLRVHCEKTQKISLAIYDVTGQKIKTLFDDVVEKGTHEYLWDGRSEAGMVMPTGVYFAQLSNSQNNYSVVQKMTLVK